MILLDRILAPGGLRVLFQPVVELSGASVRLHGLECLTRGPQDSNAARADVLFDYVRRKGAAPLVDRACIAVALGEAGRLSGTPNLSVNVHASTLGRDRDFPAFLAATAHDHAIDPTRLTIEIVEHTPHWDGVTFVRTVRALRALGARIALDDVGLGHSNYRMMVESEPEYLKIDRFFVHGAYSHPHRGAVLESIARLGMKLGARVIGEGVEDVADVLSLQEIGIDLIQGNLVAAPLTRDQIVAGRWLDRATRPFVPMCPAEDPSSRSHRSHPTWEQHS